MPLLCLRRAPQCRADTRESSCSPWPYSIPTRANLELSLPRTLRAVREKRNEYGFADVDPLLWLDAKYLLAGPSHTEALRLLDESSRTRADQQISDPVRRAVLQRNLWTELDWAAPMPNNEAHPERLELAWILRRLALTARAPEIST